MGLALALPILELGGKLIDKLIPDPAAKAKAQFDLLQLQQQGEFKDEENRFSAIIAEAKSEDKWTSRARPSFLYVVYVLLLASLPMGLLSAVSPDIAVAIATGMRAWLEAIPSSIVELFQWVMLGYIGGRSFEKVKGTQNGK
jgi:Holin of 3TMs, for gene-transfer release